MDGSIADSTVLRMRTQLQRMHHAAPATGADGFLEELLKLPAAPATDSADDATASDATATDLPTTQAVGPGKDSRDKGATDDDKEPTEDAAPLPTLPVCYAPITLPPQPTPQPVPVAPKAENEQAVQPTLTETQSVDVTTTALAVTPVDESDAAVATDAPQLAAETQAADVVEPIAEKTQAASLDARIKTRETRRAPEAKEKKQATVDEPKRFVQEAPAAARSTPSKPEEAQPTQAPTDQSQAALPTEQTQGPQVTEGKADRDGDKRADRDKWYEGDAKSSDVQSASLVDRMQAELGDSDGQPKDDADTKGMNATKDQAAAGNDSAGTADATSSGTLEAAAMNGDMAAATQAGVAQSVNSQRVVEATASSHAEGAVRGGQAVGGSSGANMAGAIGSLTRGATGNGRAASAQSSSSSKTEEPREITQQERVRLVQRVARSFSRLGPEGGQVTLKLHPPQLGVLNVSIKIEGQSMTARLQTETSSARDAIVESLPVLRDRLKEQGIEIEKFQVEVGQQDSSTGGGLMNGSSSGGSGSQQNESSATGEYDYRRVARGQASRQNLAAPAIVEPKLQGWAAADRSLDVRA